MKREDVLKLQKGGGDIEVNTLQFDKRQLLVHLEWCKRHEK